MWVTLYCDGSFNHETRVGSISVWLRCDLGRVVRSRPLPKCRGALEAETEAMKWGVQLARETWPITKAVQVNSDCMDVVRRFSGQRIDGVYIRTKHVKAHTGGSDTRSYLNSRVDKFAKKARKQAENRPAPKRIFAFTELCPNGLFDGDDGSIF